MECGGKLNFTGSINANGGKGGDSGNATITSGASTVTACGASGSGAAAGTITILYNDLIANTGTISTTGGGHGTLGTPSGGVTANLNGDTGGIGGDGFSLVAKNEVFA
jgi:hypothetical protein